MKKLNAAVKRESAADAALNKAQYGTAEYNKAEKEWKERCARERTEEELSLLKWCGARTAFT
jgi:hypothetical protein